MGPETHGVRVAKIWWFHAIKWKVEVDVATNMGIKTAIQEFLSLEGYRSSVAYLIKWSTVSMVNIVDESINWYL